MLEKKNPLFHVSVQEALKLHHADVRAEARARATRFFLRMMPEDQVKYLASCPAPPTAEEIEQAKRDLRSSHTPEV